MATGGSGGQGVIARAVVQIGADESEFDAVTKALPRKTQEQFQKVTSNIAAAMARNNQAIAAAQSRQAQSFGANGGGIAAYNAARIQIEKLSAANVALESDARRAAQAMLNMGRSAQLAGIQAANAAMQQAAAAQKAYAATVNASAATQRKAAQMNRGGAGGGGGGFGGGGGANGAMALMMLGQTIDDLQYGFRSIVNNIPMLASTLLQAFGVGSKAAMAFSGVIGIVAVVINQLIAPVTNLLTNLDGLSAVVDKDSFFGKFIEKLKVARDWLLQGADAARQMWEWASKELGYDVGKGAERSSIAAAGAVKSQAQLDRDKITKELGEGGAAAIAKVGGGGAAVDLLMKRFEGKGYSADALQSLRAQMADVVSKVGNPQSGGADAKDIDKFLDAIKGTRLAGLTQDNTPAAIAADKARQDARAEQRRKDDEAKKSAIDRQNKAAERFVDDVVDGVGPRIRRSMLRDPDNQAARAGEAKNVRDALKRSGLGDDEINAVMPEVMKKIADKLNEAIAARVLAENITPERARAEEFKELTDKAKEDAKAKVEKGVKDQQRSEMIGSGGELVNRLIAAGLNGKSELQVQQDILKVMEENTVQTTKVVEGVNRLANLRNPALAARFK